MWGGGDDGHQMDEKLWLSAGLVKCERCKISLWGTSRADETCVKEEDRGEATAGLSSVS